MSDFEVILQEVIEELNYPEVYDEIENIEYNNKLRYSGGRIKGRKGAEGYKYIIEVNPKVPDNKLKEVIKHEVAHAITKANDNTKKFKKFCNRHNVILKHNMNIGENYKYEVYCKQCNMVMKKFRRKSKTVKGISNSPDNWKCLKCSTVGNLVVRKV
mgnify:CR=1 FL=1